MKRRTAATVPVRGALLALTAWVVLCDAQAAFAYGVNSHVAACADVLDTLQTQNGIWIRPKPPPPNTCATEDEPLFVPFPQGVKQAILMAPQFFLGGCVAPDGHVLPLITDVTHAAAFDPIGLARVLIAQAQSPPEIAYAYGWLAHAATDAAVHGFANHFADGPFSKFSLSSPSTWKYAIQHLRSEIYVQEHWIRTPSPPPAIDMPIDFLRRQFFDLDGAGLRHLLGRRDADPERLDVLQTGAVRLLEAIGQADEFLSGLTASAVEQARVHAAEAAAIKTASAWTWFLRPAYYVAGAKESFFRQAALAVNRARQDLRAIQFEFLQNNLNFSKLMVAQGDLFGGLKQYLGWLAALPNRVLNLVGAALFELLPQWAEDLVTEWQALRAWVDDLFDLGIEEWITARFEDAKAWLLAQARNAISWAAQPFVDALIMVKDVVLDAAYFVPTADIDADFVAAGAKKDQAATGSNRDCLRGYHFYRNARLLTLGALSDPTTLQGIRSLDDTCEYRHSRFFREHDDGTYANFVHNQGPEPTFTDPYCFAPHVMADAPSYPWALGFDPARDWRLVEVCEAGETRQKRVPPSVCGLFGTPQVGPCAAGKGFFLSDRLMPESCVPSVGLPEARQKWGLWAMSGGAAPSETSPEYTQYHNHNIFQGSPVIAIGASPDASKVAVFVRATTEPPAAEDADNRVLVMNANGSGVETVHITGSPLWPSPHFEVPPTVRWSPDGTRILYESPGGPDNPNVGRLFIAGPGRPASEIVSGAAAFLWRASGEGPLYFKNRGGEPGMVAYDESCALEHGITPPGLPLLEWPFAVGAGGRVFHGLYEPDKLPTMPSNFASRYGVRSEDGLQSGEFNLGNLMVDFVAWSPTGQRLVASGFGGAQLRIYYADLGEAGYPSPGQTVSTLEIGRGYAPSFSPDGRYLAYESFTDAPGCLMSLRFDGIRVVDLSTPSPFTRIHLGLPDGYPSPATCVIPHRFDSRFDQPGDERSPTRPRIYAWGVSSGGPVLFASFPVQKPAYCKLTAGTPPCSDPPFGNVPVTQAPDYDVFQHTLSGDWTNLTEDWRAAGRTTHSGAGDRCSATRQYSNEFHVVGVAP